MSCLGLGMEEELKNFFKSKLRSSDQIIKALELAMLTSSEDFEKLAMTTPVEAVDKLSRSALNHESIIAAMLFGYGVGLTMLKLQVMPGNTRLIYAYSVDLIGVQEQINELTRAGGLAELEMCVLERLKERANFFQLCLLAVEPLSLEPQPCPSI